MTRRPPAPPPGPDLRLKARVEAAVEGLDTRLQAVLDDWASHAPPRRQRLGHSPNCPNLGRPMRRCGWCRAEQLGRKDEPAARPALPAQAQPAAPAPPEPLAELRACTTCYRPTDHHSVLCDRCRTE